jgi:glycosyltransferase involved in cell wall biosynthesis
VFNVSYLVTGGDHSLLAAPPRRHRLASEPWRLMFVGRMDRLKGGATLIDALPRTQAQIGHALHLTFAGDGPLRRAWTERAANVMRSSGQITIEFTGWLRPEILTGQFDSTDVVVVPSLWPEPFGLVGPEANRRGVPVVAFATGGIPEWLHEGINGCLAPADPPTADGLSDALLRCLRSLDASDAMRLGAIREVGSRPDAGHLQALLDVLGRAASNAYPIGA